MVALFEGGGAAAARLAVEVVELRQRGLEIARSLEVGDAATADDADADPFHRHDRPARYHSPTFFIEAHGSCCGRGAPACRSSIEMASGERTKAMWPSRGGRLMLTPASMSLWQVA